jgi:hypothetical protein
MFRKKRTDVPLIPMEYPVGSFIKTEAGYFYIQSNTKRLRFISDRVLKSWNPPRIIQTSEIAVENYKVFSKMKFRTGSLIYNASEGRIYYIQGNKRRPLLSGFTLERLGASLKDVVYVSLDEIQLHELGETLK